MNIILPNFYNNFLYVKNFINTFSFSQEINIKGISGIFPFSFFSKTVNYNANSSICLYPNMRDVINEFKKLDMILLNFDDENISPKDYYNNYLKIQFESFSEEPNIYFVIGDNNFLSYIIKTYPKAKIIITDNIQNYSKNIYGLISDDINLLDSTNLPIKILKTNFYNCKFCNYFNKCQEIDLEAMKQYSKKSAFLECPNIDLLPWESFGVKENYYILFDEVKINDKIYWEYLFNNLTRGKSNDKI